VKKVRKILKRNRSNVNVIEFGDCREILKRWIDEGVQVHTCVTSPPYYGLRDYGVDGQIGMEETPEEYVANLVEIFRLVRKVLRDDGTLWLNLGDSYASNLYMRNAHKYKDRKDVRGGEYKIKAKDLMGIPWRVAFALQADGWYLRQDIIWHKPNPMPEAVADRCTKAHEYIFLLSKSKKYYYDQLATLEPAISGIKSPGKSRTDSYHKLILPDGTPPFQQEVKSWGSIDGNRNKHSVWTVTLTPYKEAHFATYPPSLIEPCILAGTSEKGCCPVCGSPWERKIKRRKTGSVKPRTFGKSGNKDRTDIGWVYEGLITTTVGWRPTCSCNAGDPVPCIVLDPFMGSGTTAAVAVKHNRNYIGCELNKEYKKLQDERIKLAKIDKYGFFWF